MAVSYKQYHHKKLNQVVIAGTHDAGITGGSFNVRTQSLNIGEQADAGVRIFDIRIEGQVAGSATTITGQQIKQIDLGTYHGATPKSKKYGTTAVGSGALDYRAGKATVKTSMKFVAAFGQKLNDLLQDAADFVEQNKTEFLILKFDKSSNWPLIAQACVTILDKKIFTKQCNLNEQLLKDLAGYVIVVFTNDGLIAIDHSFQTKGILGVKSLFDGKNAMQTYVDDFKGLQYVGKGGTNPYGASSFDAIRGFRRKLDENIKSQTNILSGQQKLKNKGIFKKFKKTRYQGHQLPPEAMGMMYWTATGAVGSIKRRNNFLWKHKDELMDMWDKRVPASQKLDHPSSAPALKEFLPNIIMIDFATPQRCQEIFEMNGITGLNLTAIAADNDDGDED